MNTIASALMLASTLLNVSVWFNVKKLSIFEEEFVQKIPPKVIESKRAKKDLY